MPPTQPPAAPTKPAPLGPMLAPYAPSATVRARTGPYRRGPATRPGPRQSPQEAAMDEVRDKVGKAKEAAFEVHTRLGRSSDVFVTYAVARRRAMFR